MAFEKTVLAQRSHILSSKSDIRCHKGALQRGRQSLSDATRGTSNNRKIIYYWELESKSNFTLPGVVVFLKYILK